MSHTHGHSHNHSHSHSHGADSASDRDLVITLLLNVGITVAQVVGGVIAGSLALVADAAHNASDAASLGVSYGARRISRRKADRRRTFGYQRAEVIGALINLTTLVVIALFLIVQAVQRFFEPGEVHGTIMLIVGAIAFVEDAISAWLLFRHREGSVNITSAYIHMIGDTLATIGVIVGSLLIMQWQVYWVDPAITLAIAAYILIHSYTALKTCIRILMESAPVDFDIDAMVDDVESMEGVDDVHHVHVWRLDEQRVALEAHVAVTTEVLLEADRLKQAIKKRLHDHFGIEHATLEMEFECCQGHEALVIREE